jgi:hypothetical protein
MRNRRVTKHADHVQQCVGVPERGDVEQGCGPGFHAADAGDVGELDRRRDVLPRIEERGQLIEPFVGNPRDADIGLRLTGGTRRFPGTGEQLKKCGFPRRGKANQAGTKHLTLIAISPCSAMRPAVPSPDLLILARGDNTAPAIRCLFAGEQKA